MSNEDDDLDDFLGNALCGERECNTEGKPRLTKREKRMQKRDRRNAEGSRNRKGYGHTPEEKAAKKERIAVQKANIERKQAMAALLGEGEPPPGHEFRSKWELIEAEEGDGDAANEGEGEVLLYYKYVDVPDPEAETLRQATLCNGLGLKGRIRVASEGAYHCFIDTAVFNSVLLAGINGTLGGPAEAIQVYRATMDADPVFGGINWKLAPGGSWAFDNLRVRKCSEVSECGVNITLLTPTR